MRTRRAFLTALVGLPLLGGIVIIWRDFAAIFGPRARAEQTVTAIIDFMFPGDGVPSAVSLGIADAIKGMPEFEALIPDGVAWFDKALQILFHWMTTESNVRLRRH